MIKTIKRIFSIEPYEKNHKLTLFSLQFVLLELCILTLVALAVHAFVLYFVFPGYYSPLWPNHSDYYIQAALANSPEGILSYAKWPRPIGMMFAYLTGFLGIKGSIAAIIFLTAVNCALSVILIRRILNIGFKWPFLMSFVVYLYLLFSQPHFYGFYAHDCLAQLSYFFLINAVYWFFIFRERSILFVNLILFCLTLLAFFSKEVYGISALIVAGAWFFYSRKECLIRAVIPILVVGSTLLVSLAYNAYIKSVFLNVTKDTHSPYAIDLSPVSVFKEISIYITEGYNLANLGVIAIILITVCLYYRAFNRKVVYFIFVCLFAAGFAWLPNALLPNHHFSGYSWNGAYILYLPIILIPVFWQSDVRLRFLSVILISLAFISPILNKAEYLKNNWLLIQENTQRNLLTSLEPLMEGLSIDNSEKILVTGLVFPFSPFKFPQSLRTYPKMHNANFDVVTYSSDLIGERIDLVKFIRPIDVDLQNYTKIWMFSSDGYLVRELRIGIDSIVPVLGLEAKDFVIFPDVAVIFGLDNAVSVNPEISSDGYRLLNCGNAFSAYKQSELALRCYVASTKKIPENPYGWFGAGVELERLNRFDEAKQYFAQSVEHDNTKTPNPAFKKAYLKSKRHSTVNTSDDSIRH